MKPTLSGAHTLFGVLEATSWGLSGKPRATQMNFGVDHTRYSMRNTAWCAEEGASIRIEALQPTVPLVTVSDDHG